MLATTLILPLLLAVKEKLTKMSDRPLSIKSYISKEDFSDPFGYLPVSKTRHCNDVFRLMTFYHHLGLPDDRYFTGLAGVSLLI